MSDIELRSPEFSRDPYPFYQGWREEAPIWWSDALEGWVISRYADVKRGFTDYGTFRQSRAFDGALRDTLGIDPMVQLDPPAHKDVRRVFSAYYRPRVLEEEMAGVIDETATSLVASITRGTPFELKDALARPLTMHVMAWMIGSDDSDELGKLYQAVLAYMRAVRLKQVDAVVDRAGREAGAALMSYLFDLRRQRAPAPGLNLIAELPEYENVSDEVIVASCAGLLLAGVENSISGIATTVWALLAHLDQLELVKANPSLAGNAFDEAVRVDGPVQMTGKVIGEEVTVAGQQLTPGEEVFLLGGSANRDPDAWEDPERFDLMRSNTNSLGFGSGIHVCIGAPLVRLEARILIERLLAAFPDVRLDASQPPPRFDGAPLYRIPNEIWLVES